jgi:putative pyruvate formate lyase activating enzyme
VNRLGGETGQCGVGGRAWVSSYGPHLGEEDPLRGVRGSGTIFFGGCNLHCMYCQNADISQRISGVPVSAKELAGMMLELQNIGCHNINLVSPTHVASQAAEAILLAAQKGLKLPIVYNTGGYDAQATLELLEGLIDIYMPDMKYSDASIAQELSDVEDYPAVNQEAVLEMHRQVGDLKLDRDGIAQRGLLIRHLVLPGDLAGSKQILQFLADRISVGTYLNIMDQYRPAYRARQKEILSRRITRSEYEEVVQLALGLGLKRLDLR